MTVTSNTYAWLHLLGSLLPFLSFVWGLRWHFDTGGRIPRAMRLLSVVNLTSYMSYIGLLTYHQNLGLQSVLPLAAFATSLLLFWWTVIVTRQHRPMVAHADADPGSLYSSGPYAYVRHPFYLSYIIFWIGTAIDAGTWQWVPTIGLTLWYARIAYQEERRFRTTKLRLPYATYRRKTGMFWPHLVSQKDRSTADVLKD